MSTITLITDFGLNDWFAGTMKGVILSTNPRATVVDITHGISAGDIRSGALALAGSYHFFPAGAVHVAVVDPGVGSQRLAIAVRTARYVFVGPDNGVLSFALARERITAIHRLANDKFFLPRVSTTFHGRDIFAPVAGHLSKGIPIGKLGPRLSNFTRLHWPQPRRTSNAVRGEIIHLDHFGNAITNLDESALDGFSPSACMVLVKRKVRCPMAPFYGAVPGGKPLAVMGSSGFLEIAVNGGSAARKLGLKPGHGVVVRIR